MIKILSLLVLMLSFFFSPASAIDNPVKNIELRIEKILESGSVLVTINNTSKLPIRMWMDSNSWGAARWRVLVVRNARLETFFQYPEQGFTRNIPTFIEIAGEGQINKTLDLNAGEWCWLDQCSFFGEKGIGGEMIKFNPKDSIIVVYDVPRTAEAASMGVWFGVAATMYQPMKEKDEMKADSN